MRKIISLFTLCAIGFVGFQSFKFFKQEDKWANCFVKYRSLWGDKCSSCQMQTNTYKVFLRNDCDVAVDAVVAVQENTKRWKYYSFKKLAPKDSTSAYACVGTGRYIKFVKPSDNMELILPTAEQVNEQYAK